MYSTSQGTGFDLILADVSSRYALETSETDIVAVREVEVRQVH